MDKQIYNLETDFKKGDLIWIESPMNPCGEITDFQLYASRQPGVILCVDSTLAPPPIQYCLKSNVDVVLHSSSKYFGGHSDLLGLSFFNVRRRCDGEIEGNIR